MYVTAYHWRILERSVETAKIQVPYPWSLDGRTPSARLSQWKTDATRYDHHTMPKLPDFTSKLNPVKVTGEPSTCWLKRSRAVQ